MQDQKMNSDLMFQMASTLFEARQDFERCEILMTEVVQREQDCLDNADKLHLLGSIQFERQKYSEAIKQF